MIARLRAWLHNFRRRPAVPRWREYRGVPLRELDPFERVTPNDHGERWLERGAPADRRRQ